MKRFRIAGMMAVGLAVSIMFIMVGSLHAGGHIKRGGTLNYIKSSSSFELLIIFLDQKSPHMIFTGKPLSVSSTPSALITVC